MSSNPDWSAEKEEYEFDSNMNASDMEKFVLMQSNDIEENDQFIQNELQQLQRQVVPKINLGSIANCAEMNYRSNLTEKNKSANQIEMPPEVEDASASKSQLKSQFYDENEESESGIASSLSKFQQNDGADHFVKFDMFGKANDIIQRGYAGSQNVSSIISPHKTEGDDSSSKFMITNDS